MSAPLVSVVIPVRNYERYVGAAIESILAQSFTDFELIVVDDASTDATFSIIESYRDESRIRIFRNEQRLGQFPTHNRGAAAARGRYLKFFHGDDIMFPHCLEVFVLGMEAHPEAGLAISQPSRLSPPPRLFSPEEAWRAQMAGQTSMLSESPSGVMYRSEVFAGAGGYDPRFHTSDAQMSFRVAMEYPVLLLANGLYWYRRHSGSVTHALQDDTHAAEGHVWLAELLGDRRNPLPLGDRERLRAQGVRNAWRLALRRLRQGRALHAWRIRKRLRAAWGELPLAFAQSQVIDGLPETGSSVGGNEDPGRPVFSKTSEETSGVGQGSPVQHGWCPSPSGAPSALVSVLIPAWNAAAHLREAIESVRAQSWPHWELVIVDDASTDETSELATGFADGDRIRLVKNESRLGKWANHNRAAQLARGEYLKFLHADDLLLPQGLEQMVWYLDRFPQAALLQCHEAELYLCPKLQTPREIWRQAFFGAPAIWESPTGALYRRSAWRQLGGYRSTDGFAPARFHLESGRAFPSVLAPAGLAWYRRGSAELRRANAGEAGCGIEDLTLLREALDRKPCPLDELEISQARRNLELVAARNCRKALCQQDSERASELARFSGGWGRATRLLGARPVRFGWDYWYGEHHRSARLDPSLYKTLAVS